MKLTTEDLEALRPGAQVTPAPDGLGERGMIYTKIDPPGPNGPWRRPVTEGPDAGKWVTTKSSVLAMIGVVRA